MIAAKVDVPYLFRFLQVAWGFAQTGHLPHHDHGHVEGLEDEAPLIPGAVTADVRDGGDVR